jgi:hypothetical protein
LLVGKVLEFLRFLQAGITAFRRLESGDSGDSSIYQLEPSLGDIPDFCGRVGAGHGTR